MREPTRYERLVWWLEYRWHDLVRKSTGMVYRFVDSRPRLEKVLLRLFPTPLLWVLARYEWEMGQTMNDGPDEYYMLWPDYWKFINEKEKVKCC